MNCVIEIIKRLEEENKRLRKMLAISEQCLRVIADDIRYTLGKISALEKEDGNG